MSLRIILIASQMSISLTTWAQNNATNFNSSSIPIQSQRLESSNTFIKSKTDPQSDLQKGLKTKPNLQLNHSQLNMQEMKAPESKTGSLFQKSTKSGNANGGGGGDTGKALAAENQIDIQKKADELEKQKKLDESVRSLFANYLKSKVQNNILKKDILELVQDQKFIHSIPHPARKIMEDLLQRGLVADIKASDYNLNDSCLVDGKRKTLSTLNGTVHQPRIGEAICVDMNNFVSVYTEKYSNLRKEFENPENLPLRNLSPYPVWLLFGLFIHDHARHFGHLDEDHSLAAQMSRSAFENQRKTQTTEYAELMRLISKSDDKQNSVISLNFTAPATSKATLTVTGSRLNSRDVFCVRKIITDSRDRNSIQYLNTAVCKEIGKNLWLDKGTYVVFHAPNLNQIDFTQLLEKCGTLGDATKTIINLESQEIKIVELKEVKIPVVADVRNSYFSLYADYESSSELIKSVALRDGELTNPQEGLFSTLRGDLFDRFLKGNNSLLTQAENKLNQRNRIRSCPFILQDPIYKQATGSSILLFAGDYEIFWNIDGRFVRADKMSIKP